MKIVAKKGQLQEALQVVGGLVNPRNPLPVLTHLKCEARQGTLTMSATDLTISANLKLPVEVVNEGGVTIPARALLDILRSVEQSDIDITITADSKHHLLINIGSRFKTKQKLIGGALEEFPTLDVQQPTHSFTLPAATLRAMINNTAFAASTVDETRQYLTGINIVSKGGLLVFVATNSHKLALMRLTWPGKDKVGDFNIVVPAKALQELLKNITSDESPVSITIAANHVSFAHGALQLTSRLIDEEYPAYEKVIPAKPLANRVGIDPLALHAALTEVGPSCDDKTRQIFLRFKGPTLALAAASGISGKEGEGIMEVEAPAGLAVEVSFNIDYLKEIISRFAEGAIEFQISDGAHPCVLVDPRDSGFLCLLMPVRN